MTAYFSTFYQLIVFPFDFVKSYRHQTPLKLCFFSLTIFCLSQLHQTTGPNDSLLLHLALMIGGYAIFIVIQSVFTDFFAQFFHLIPQSLRLFSWLGISLIPFSLDPALYLLLVCEWITPGIYQLCHWVIIGFVLVWQVKIIQTLYQIPTRKSVIIFILPFFVLFTAFFLVIGFSLLTLSL